MGVGGLWEPLSRVALNPTPHPAPVEALQLRRRVLRLAFIAIPDGIPIGIQGNTLFVLFGIFL